MFILLGLPGSGKSVQADLFKEKNHIHHIAPGIALRKMAEENHNEALKEILKNGSLVDDKMVASIIDEAIKKTGGENFIIEGYPRTMDQITKYKNILQKDGKFFIKKVLVLDMDPEVLMARLTSRKVCAQCHKSFSHGFITCDRCNTPLTTRSDDTPEAITTRLKVQGDHLNSIIKFFQDEGVTVQFINGNQSFEQVHEAIKAAMDQ